MAARLPNFLGIGTQRGATTWLFNCLHEHSDVFVPDMKEVSFFDIHYDKGLPYYASFFKDAGRHAAVGEITPDYLYGRESAGRIFKHLPDAKMIAILRNPIDRAFSAYQFFIQPRTGWTFEEAIAREPLLLEKGLYGDQLQRFFSYFHRDRFLILLYEELMRDNLSAIQSVYSFLGVDHRFRPSWTGKTANTKHFPRLRKSLDRVGLSWTIPLIKRTPLDSAIRTLHAKRKQRGTTAVDLATQGRLIEYFREPNQRLEELINRNLTLWVDSSCT